MLSALNAGMYPLVPRIANRARSEGVKLTEASYTILIQALAEAGGSDQAVQCLDQLVSEGLRPNVITYAAEMAAVRHRPQVGAPLDPLGPARYRHATPSPCASV